MTAVAPTVVSLSEPVPAALSWLEANRRHLYAALEVVRLRMALAGSRSGDGAAAAEAASASDVEAAQAAVDQAAAAVGGRSTLGALVDLFGLSAFERDVVLLAAGHKLVPDFGGLPAGATRTRAIEPSFELAFRTLAEPHWAAITPNASLRRYHLIELDRPEDPVRSPLRIDERILFFLLGIPTIDARLRGLIEPLPHADGDLPSGYARLAEQIGAIWSWGGSERPVVQLTGSDPEGKRSIAAAGAAVAGLGLYMLRGSDAQFEAAHRVSLASLIDRELLLTGAALLVVVEDEPDESRAVRALVSRLAAPVVIARRDPLSGLLRKELRLEMEPLDPADQRRLWRACLEGRIDQEQVLDRIVGHFRFGPSGIRSAAAAFAANRPERRTPDALWEACRRAGRSRLSDLAQRIESGAGWDDLILPAPQKQTLSELAANLGHLTTVHERWGFGSRGARGLGLTALFHGESGTGKTLAAEVIANQVRLDLWRIDLSRMLDKYIGETEKNLRRIFDAAEESGAILLFDEADALFSRRTEVKDSVDRFANVEVGYLLQRMETYSGLAILTTNMSSSIDSAFMRRIRFVVNFPFPKSEQRALIWSKAFPPGTPTAGLNTSRLAQLNMPGGNIRNIALNAAFLAASEARAVGMDHLLRAARSESSKLERTLSAAEVVGWT